jgi:hypothetical protein
VVKQLPGTRLQHDGTVVHFVITFCKNKDTVCLSVGTTFGTEKHFARFVYLII